MRNPSISPRSFNHGTESRGYYDGIIGLFNLISSFYDFLVPLSVICPGSGILSLMYKIVWVVSETKPNELPGKKTFKLDVFLFSRTQIVSKTGLVTSIFRRILTAVIWSLLYNNSKLNFNRPWEHLMRPFSAWVVGVQNKIVGSKCVCVFVTMCLVCVCMCV